MNFMNAQEKNAVKSVVAVGRTWGFGNLIDRLKIAWVLSLKEAYPEMSWEAVCDGGLLNNERTIRIALAAKINEPELIQSLKEYIGEDTP